MSYLTYTNYFATNKPENTSNDNNDKLYGLSVVITDNIDSNLLLEQIYLIKQKDIDDDTLVCNDERYLPLYTAGFDVAKGFNTNGDKLYMIIINGNEEIRLPQTSFINSSQIVGYDGNAHIYEYDLANNHKFVLSIGGKEFSQFVFKLI